VDDRFQIQTINYGADKTPVHAFNRYFRNHPDRDIDVEAGVLFRQFLPAVAENVSVEYALRHTYERRTSDMFNLHLSDGFFPGETAIGVLPSETEYMKLFSAADSYNSRLTVDEHRFKVQVWGINLYLKSLQTMLNGKIEIPLSIYRRRYHYIGRGVDEQINRTDIGTEAINSGANVVLKLKFPRHWELELSPEYHLKPVDMQKLLSVTDATNPLFISLGNPDLKAMSVYTFTGDLKYACDQRRHSFRLSYLKIDNAMGIVTLYNPRTGAYTTMPRNVSGNWTSFFNYEFFRAFGTRNQFDVATRSFVSCMHNVDFSGVSDNADSGGISDVPLNIVDRWNAIQTFKGNWKSGRHRISLNADVSMNRYNGSFERFTSWTYKYGGAVVFNFPKDWSVASDISLYSRRGFADRRLNTTDLVWNARLTKSVMGGRLLFIADGYDLLRQLSNVSYTINAQARTETVSNVIPSYVLFHIQYRFNKNPGKK